MSWAPGVDPYVVDEDPWCWIVECAEFGCGKTIAVPKRVGVPLDPSDPYGEVHWIPGELRPRGCVRHPPNGPLW